MQQILFLAEIIDAEKQLLYTVRLWGPRICTSDFFCSKFLSNDLRMSDMVKYRVGFWPYILPFFCKRKHFQKDLRTLSLHWLAFC